MYWKSLAKVSPIYLYDMVIKYKRVLEGIIYVERSYFHPLYIICLLMILPPNTLAQ